MEGDGAAEAAAGGEGENGEKLSEMGKKGDFSPKRGREFGKRGKTGNSGGKQGGKRGLDVKFGIFKF